MKILIRAPYGLAGGLLSGFQGFLQALAKFGTEDQQEEEYLIETHERNLRGIALGPNQRLVSGTAATADLVHAFALPYEKQPQQNEGRKLPHVATLHDTLWLHFPKMFSESDRAWRDRQARHALANYDRAIAISDWLREDLIAKFPAEANAGNLSTIRWPAPTEFVTGGDSTPTTIPAFCLCQGGTVAQKNHMGLLRAVKLLGEQQRLPADFRLVCVGRLAEEWPKIETFLDENDLTGVVSFVGEVSQRVLKTVYYRNCRFLVHPSLYETAGLPLVEAWLEGAPVACSNVGALPEYAGGDAALLFDPNDVRAVADALLRMWTDDGLRRSLIQAGKSRLAQFSWAACAEAYRSVYRTVVQQAAAAAARAA